MEGFFADPDIWRQPQQDVVANGRLSRTACHLGVESRSLSWQEAEHRAAVHRRFFLRGVVMAKQMKHVDAVMVGMGWTGSIMARELTKAGLYRRRPRARRTPHARGRFHAARDPRRAEISAALSADAGQRYRDADHAAYGGRDGLADAALGRVSARRWIGRRGHALERCHLAEHSIRIRPALAIWKTATAEMPFRPISPCRTGASPMTTWSPGMKGLRGCAAHPAGPAT